MPYVKYALTKSIGKKRIFSSDKSLDKILGCQSPKIATKSFASGLKKRKLNIAKLKLIKERMLAKVSQKVEKTHHYMLKQANTDVDEEYSQSTGLDEDNQ